MYIYTHVLSRDDEPPWKSLFSKGVDQPKTRLITHEYSISGSTHSPQESMINSPLSI